MRPAPAPPTPIERHQLDEYRFYLLHRITQLRSEIELYTPQLACDQPGRTPAAIVAARRRVHDCHDEIAAIDDTLDALADTFTTAQH